MEIVSGGDHKIKKRLLRIITGKCNNKKEHIAQFFSRVELFFTTGGSRHPNY